MVSRPAEDQHVSSPKRPRQQQRRLAADEIDEVVAKYIEGESIDGLARVYGINRTTVISHLERSGVERRGNPRKMTDAKVQAAAERYSSNFSLTIVASEFGVCERTLRREFEQAGVPTRRRRGIDTVHDG
jgi:transposase-like protein